MALLCAGCAPQVVASPTQSIQERHNDGSGEQMSSPQMLARSRAAALRDAADILGGAAVTEVMRARSAVLVRSIYSLPRMIQQPDGSWKPEPPSVAAAVRGPAGWTRIGAGGTRTAFDPAASKELDRLLGSQSFWAQQPVDDVTCTDPSGIVLIARRDGREFVSPYPCGLTGASEAVARLVRAGRITDWAAVPRELRPPGLPLRRFDQATQQNFLSQSGLADQRLLAIRSEAEWVGQWNRMTRPLGNRTPPPRFDFQREMLLIAAMGRQRSGGYQVAIDRVIDAEPELLVFVRFISPGPRCGAIGAITSPVDIVRLPVSTKNVRFVVEREERECR